MYIPLGIKTDYSLLQSLIKIPDLINILKEHNVTACGILDDNLFGSMCFYNSCINNDIKPIIGLSISINEYKIYLYAKNYDGYQNLLKINTQYFQSFALNSLSIVFFSCNSHIKSSCCFIF